MDLDLRGFLMDNKGKADGIVSTDKGRELTGNELRAYCWWGLCNGYRMLSELPEFEELEEELERKGMLW